MAQFGIAYKDNPLIPATAGGRAIAIPTIFDSREEAEDFLRRHGLEWLHAVEIMDPIETETVQVAKGLHNG